MAFISEWSIPLGGSDANRKVILPIISGTILNDITVNWGDTFTNTYNFQVTNENRPSHIYTIGGFDATITITGTGKLSGWSFAGGLGTPALLKSINQYGNLELANTGSQFSECTNLLRFPQTGTLILTDVCSLMFLRCRNLTTDLLTFNTNTVTDMFGMFRECSAFNGNISNWNVGNVTDMSEMFRDCVVFDGNISNWNVGGVNSMSEMFFGCNAFKRDISKWVLTGISSSTPACDEVPTFSPEYIDAVKPLFSAEYPASWKFNTTDNFNNPTGILNKVIPAGKTHLYQTIEETDQNGKKFIRLERKPFVTTWTVTETNTTITLPIAINLATNIRIDWGKGGGFVDVNTGVRPTETSYTVRQEPYTISISGRINGWSFAHLEAGDISRRCFRSITSYGCLLDIDNTGSQFKDCTNLQAFPQTGTLPLPSNCSSMFQGCQNLSTSLTTLNTIDVTTMANMFSGCYSFDGNISNWGVQNVQNMSGMFENGILFTGATLFDVPLGSAVTTMSNMFSGCLEFDGVVSQWKVQNVTNMSGMFYNCPLFTGANLFALSVGSAVKYMTNMFSGCSKFNGDISAWNVQLVTDMSGMFFNCKKFTGAHLFDIPFGIGIGLLNMSNMFSGCSLFNGDISDWDVQDVTDMSGMFLNCEKFTGINLFTISEGSNGLRMNSMFSGCKIFTGNPNLKTWDVKDVTDMTSMFFNCEKFTGEHLFAIPDGSDAKLMNSMFSGCKLFIGNDNLSNWFVQRATDMTSMFFNCEKFTGEHLFAIPDGSVVTLMNSMFSGCKLFTGNDKLSTWNVRKVTNMANIFEGCTLFRTDISKWVLTGISANNRAPTFIAEYIDVVKPKFSSAYRGSWKFTAYDEVSKNIIDTILPANRKEMYYIDDNLRLRTLDDKDEESSASAITGSGNSSIKYSSNSRINIFF